MINCAFSGNSANDGGAVLLRRGPCMMIGGTFSDNVARHVEVERASSAPAPD